MTIPLEKENYNTNYVMFLLARGLINFWRLKDANFRFEIQRED